jgi:hypothetical protein
MAMIGGHLYDRDAGILVEERASRFGRGRRRGNLYVLVEVTGQSAGREVITERMASAVRDVYYGQRHSVTAGLQQAIREANTLLHNENQHSVPEEQMTAGVSCAVLRDDDLFIAQAGPAALYVAHQQNVTRYPEVSPWLDDVVWEDADAAPLGTHRQVRVDLFHARLTTGDTILLVDSDLARRAPPEAWHDILIATPVEAALDGLLAMSAGSDLSSLIVRLGKEGSGNIAVRPTVPAGVQGPEPLPAAAAGQLAREQVAQEHAAHDQAAREQTAQQPVDQRTAQAPVGERARPAGQSLAAAGAAFLIFVKRMVPSPPKPWETPRRQAVAGESSGKKGKRRQRDASPGQPRSAALQRLLLGIAIAIPLIVAGVVAFTVIQRGQNRQAELEGLWLNAQDRWTRAQATSDRATIRALLAEADESLDRLLAHRPDHADALNLRGRIKARLEESTQVRRVRWESELMTYPKGAKPSRVVVEGVHVFVMDRDDDKVYHHRLDEFQQALLPETRDTVLVQKGTQAGDILVGDLVDMVWMPVGTGRQKAGLLILDSDGHLLEYDPGTGELTSLRVAASETWKFPQFLGSHSGRLYLLDPTANQIWRYQPTLDGYSEPPEEWLQSAIDLVGVKDMGIGDSLYLLYANGDIHKLSTGKPDAFDISDWDSPPRAPTAIFTRPPNDAQWVYVADAGNNRIVQCSKAGQFRRQFRLDDSSEAGASDALAGVTSLFVDEIGGRAYFLSGKSLYMLILPE